MYDIREHELRLNYLRKRLAEIPHGSFGTARERACVYVDYDPADPSLDHSNKKKYYADSPQGKIWCPVIAEYLRLRREYDTLWESWNLMYRFEPRTISYPLVKRSCSPFTEACYHSAKEYSNPVIMQKPVEYKGRRLRSKNEMIGCRIIEKMGYEYKIEIPATNDPFNSLYPDITVLVPEQERCVGIEINGALDIPKYAGKSLSRQASYIGSGLMISKDIIFVDIADAGSFYADLFETQLRLAIYAGLDDIVWPHGYMDDVLRSIS